MISSPSWPVRVGPNGWELRFYNMGSSDIRSTTFGTVIPQTPGLYRVQLIVTPRQSPVGSSARLLIVHSGSAANLGVYTSATRSNLTLNQPDTLELTVVIRAGNAGEQLAFHLQSDGDAGLDANFDAYLQVDRLTD